MIKNKRVKISDIAKAAGVSSSTVSYVLSGQRTISDETKKKVLGTIKEMGYRPDATARSFAMQKTGVIGLYLQKTVSQSDLFFQASLSGIVDSISKRGYKLLLLNELEENIADDYVIPVDRTFAIDGAIVTTTRNLRHYLSEIQMVGIPFVLMGKPPKQMEQEISYVDNDNYKAAYDAVELLFRQGLRNIAVIRDTTDGTFFFDYLAGYTSAHSDYQIDFNPDFILKVCEDSHVVDNIISKIVELKIDGILLLSTNKQIHSYCVYQAENASYPIPVVSFSFDLYEEFYYNKHMKNFYSINSNAKKLGFESAELLLKLLDGKDNGDNKKLLEPQIVKW